MTQSKQTLSLKTMSFLLLSLGLQQGCDNQGTPAAEVQEGEWLAGGETTNVLLLGSQAFTFPAANLDSDRRAPFFSGDSFFNENWVTAPASTDARDGLGPTFNARACANCHVKDGRGIPPLELDETPVGVLLRISIPGQDAHGGALPDPNYGGQLQPFATLGIDPEVRIRIRHDLIQGSYADGETYTLRDPIYDIDQAAYGELHPELRVSPRVAPAMIGLGLLESIDRERLIALSDPNDADGDGISGRINMVWDVSAQRLRIGRFGWKAEQPSLLQQTAAAFLGDIGITSRLFPNNNCPAPQTDCVNAITGGEPEISNALLDKVVFYSSTLAVPVRRNWDDPDVLRGKWLFNQAGCTSCHTPSHTTDNNPDFPELSGQLIWPYTDMLLHDMGDALSDNRPVFDAEGNEWRTPPLWGLGLVEQVNQHLRLMHDGRAHSIEEAILWHGGEAEVAKENFRQMNAIDREKLITFLESL